MKLEAIEVNPEQAPLFTVIWLHGLGADGSDFEGLVPELAIPKSASVRFVFPHAPVQPVTLNGGMRMRAWYDLYSLDISRGEDQQGIFRMEQILGEVIRAEHARGVPFDHILLAGFSQGGAMALFTALRFPEKLAGIMGLSSYLPLISRMAEPALQAANQHTPVFLAHGLEDNVLLWEYGQATANYLQEQQYSVDWRSYPMGHELCGEEILAIGTWLRNIVGANGRDMALSK